MPIDHLHTTKSRSALMIAAEKGYLHVITTLLSYGANPILKDTNGLTALDYAIRCKHQDCIQLLERYQPPEKTDDDDYEKAMDQFCLAAYQLTSSKPNEIDHELLLAVIRYIHSVKPTDGSILVFLPGYDDIMAQKDLIESQLIVNNYQLFVLHSEMSNGKSNDQRQVFQKLPRGQRKIILSTNIAETSLTIDDVMYVIDSGKVKQKTYDSISDTTCLTSTWISQACAKQRAGRAGRTRDGECYRMYSLEHYETMEKYTLPEILRVPLTDVCLNAKILANDISIEDFLLKALQPPPLLSIRQSIALLKKIDALDSDENITYLGLHLADMPVDAQLGKCLLYGILAKCVDPILTIISALSVRDPFMLPAGGDGDQIQKIKNDLVKGVLSDHALLLQTYEAWLENRSKNQEKKFAYTHFINNANMEMIHGVRRLILSHLKAAGIISDRGSQNLWNLNKSSKNWTIIKACLTAGFYPNVCRLNRNGNIYSQQEKKLKPHMSSVLREGKRIKREILSSPTEWLIHGEKSRIANFTLIRNITLVAAINISLFAGPICLPQSRVQFIQNGNMHGDETDDSDSDEEYGKTYNFANGINEKTEHLMSASQPKCERANLLIDDWINFTINADEANLLYSLRQKFNGIFMRFLKNPTKFHPSKDDELTLSTMRNVLTIEDSLEPASDLESNQSVSATNEPTGQPIFMSAAYNDALNSRKKQKGNNNWRNRNSNSRNMPRANERRNTSDKFGRNNYTNSRGTQYSQRYRINNQDEPAVSDSAQEKLLYDPMNQPGSSNQCNGVTDTRTDTIPNSRGPSMLVFHPNFTKYFALSIKSIWHLKETIFRNRWFFNMSIERIQSVEKVSAAEFLARWPLFA